MSMLERFGRLPTVNEMIAALDSPIVPPSALDAADILADDAMLSTDDMIREIFNMMKNRDDLHITGSGSGGGGSGGISYDSALFDYAGAMQPLNYNGGAI